METDQGIQEAATVADYDLMQRNMRDKGWIETRILLKKGIARGHALEVGPGPGYLGLEWLRLTEGTRLTGLEISPAMIETARKNSRDYGLEGRAEYVLGNGRMLPFPADSFDAVFTNGSLHEWADPVSTFKEMWRVLKNGGSLFVSDLRRDMSFLIRWFLWLTVKPKTMRPGLITSLNAAYTADEIRDLARTSRIGECEITANPIGVVLTATK
jgi:ubiquinone/menaquinone biosynthesis C-methylase UbiE